MKARCLCCRQLDDLSNLKPTYFHVHEGRCEVWLREREHDAPLWLPSLWPLPAEGLFRYGAIVLTIIALGSLVLR